MKILYDSGVITGRKEGKWMHYSISDEGLEAVRKCLDYFTQHSKGEEELSCCKNSWLATFFTRLILYSSYRNIWIFISLNNGGLICCKIRGISWNMGKYTGCASRNSYAILFLLVDSVIYRIYKSSIGSYIFVPDFFSYGRFRLPCTSDEHFRMEGSCRVCDCRACHCCHRWHSDWEFTSGKSGTGNPFGVIIATICGIPMYADIFGCIPIAEALLAKGALLGVVLSFMMGVTTLSLPSIIMLKKAVNSRRIWKLFRRNRSQRSYQSRCRSYDEKIVWHWYGAYSIQ